ncbi:MAG TPA: hypothetical protein VM053_02550 [Gemmatimonadaceae bacterium]|nr:hypothetical protein [Gemmatimonadaceae bacterium]
MNRNRIIGSGLAAGVFILGTNVLVAEYVARHVANVPADSTPFGVYVGRMLILGVVAMLLYAIISKARGMGNETALTTGILVFLIGVLFPPFSVSMNGAMPGRALLLYIVWNAIGIPIATLAGAQFYREVPLVISADGADPEMAGSPTARRTRLSYEGN